jgi:hypothetical protein
MRWRGQPGRFEVWYATLTDRDSGRGLWIHHELVACVDGSTQPHGWATAFVPGERPLRVGSGPVNVTAPDGLPLEDPGEPAARENIRMGTVSAGPDRLEGGAEPLRWGLEGRDGGQPLFTFPRWSFRRAALPAALVVPSPTATFSGEVRVGDRVFRLREAKGAVARIYEQGCTPTSAATSLSWWPRFLRARGCGASRRFRCCSFELAAATGLANRCSQRRC